MTGLSDKYGPWALVTGASAGIGKEFACQIAAEGINLVLAARRKKLLEDLGHQLSSENGIECIAVPVDLSAPDFLTPIRAARGGPVAGLRSISIAGATHDP